jgi:hypothetical protein
MLRPLAEEVLALHVIVVNLSGDALPLASMCPAIQMNYLAVDKLSRLQIKQQVGYFSNFG